MVVVMVLAQEGVGGRWGRRVHGRGSVHEVGVGRRVRGGHHWWDGRGRLVDMLRGVLLQVQARPRGVWWGT